MVEVRDLPPPPDKIRIRRALLSVYDKMGLAAFARRLADRGIALVSSGGTAQLLREAGLIVEDVSGVTGFSEILGGRVKTLHPKVHGGILARRGDPEDEAELRARGITPIDLVVVNLYPFSATVARPGVTDAEAAENIDIGGPAMARAAAKNFAYVAVATSPADYEAIASEISASDNELCLATRRRLSHAAFEHTASYDRDIADYLSGANGLPERFEARHTLGATLRYGENPHQKAAFYGETHRLYEKLHGKALSYNNLIDLSAALGLIDEFKDDDATVAILKHTNPCGVAVAQRLEEAYARAFATDRQSPFGGVVVMNRPLSRLAAEGIDRVFTEIIIAPDFEQGVLGFLQRKKNRRLIRRRKGALQGLEAQRILGGILSQERDGPLESPAAQRKLFRCVTERQPTEAEWRDLDFTWRVAKHVKSNAIVYGRARRTLGIGAGQMSRIDASEIALMKGRKSGLDFAGSVVASDAFFPFADGLVAAAEAGARAAIQPGGSVRDREVIDAANAHGIAMVLTGRRHFRH